MENTIRADEFSDESVSRNGLIERIGGAALVLINSAHLISDQQRYPPDVR
jgi:hypothetical protein